MPASPPVVTTALLAARSGDDLVRGDLAMAAVLLAVAGWGVFLLTRARWGSPGGGRRRRGEAPGSVEMPDDPPAIAHALHHGGTAQPWLLGVLVVDLAQRGYVHVAEDGTEWRFTRKDTPRGDLRPYENAVYTRLFAAGNVTSQTGLLTWAEGNRQQARVFLDRIRRSVASDLRERGYLERPRRLPVMLNLAVSGVVVLVGLAAFVSGAFPAGLLALASGAAQASRTRDLRRHTLSGSDRAGQWAEVAHALEEVAGLDEPPATDRAGWERCLVYAAALGVADRFVTGLAEREAKVYRHKDFASWYEGAGDAPGLAGVGRLVASLGPALAETAEGPSRLVPTVEPRPAVRGYRG